MFLLALAQATEAYRIQPDIFQQTDNKPVIQITQPKQNQHIVFEEVGKMATQMKYIHVVVPLNISVLYTEAEILKIPSPKWQTKQLPRNTKFHSLKQ